MVEVFQFEGNGRVSRYLQVLQRLVVVEELLELVGFKGVVGKQESRSVVIVELEVE